MDEIVYKERLILRRIIEKPLLIHECSVPSWIFTGARGDLYRVAVEMALRREPVTRDAAVSVLGPEHPGANGEWTTITALEKPGTDPTHLRGLVDSVRVFRVREKANDLCRTTAESLAEEGADPGRICSQLIGEAGRIQGLLHGEDSLVKVGECLDVLTELEDLQQGKGDRGIRAPFSSIDKMLRGWNPGCLYVIGARPSTGKTSLMADIMRILAKEGKAGLIFSMEMSARQIKKLMFCQEIGEDPFRKAEEGEMTKGVLGRVVTFAHQISGWNLWVDESPTLEIDAIIARSRMRKITHGIDMVAVDYLQLVRASETRKSDRRLQVAEASSKLKALAKELQIPVLALAQLRRQERQMNFGKGQKETVRPRLDDLKESGDIEQDADAVILIHRNQEENSEEAELIVAKNREGPIGSEQVKFYPAARSFADE